MAWLMFSSGSRPEYLQNISTFIAVPSEGELQVRYRRKHVSDQFNDAYDTRELVGATAYLSYLDNRKKGAASRFVPTREARITEVLLMGEVYVIRLTAGRYFRHEDGKNPEDALRQVVPPADLPRWVPKGLLDHKLTGFWATKLSAKIDGSYLVEHDPVGGTHLGGFQNTATALSDRSDFRDEARRMFFNVIDVREEKSGASILGYPPLSVRTNQPYRLTIFHFYKESETHTDWKPFWLAVTSEVSDLQFSTPTVIEIASPYDIKEVHFSLPRFSEAPKIGLNIRLSTDVEGKALVSRTRVVVDTESPALVARVLIIAAALTAAQCVLIARSGWDPIQFIATVAVSIVVGLASVFKLPVRP